MGKRANLVLLDADPLTEIHNTQKIGGVVLHGRLMTQSDLTGMLTKAAQIAQQRHNAK